MAKEKTKKTKKPFLIAGLVLLGIGAAIGISFGVTGSILLVRDLVWTALLLGVGTGIGIPLYKGTKALFTNVFTKNKDKTQQRTITKDKKQERTQDMEEIPVVKKEVAPVYQTNNKKEVKPSSKKKGK